MKGIYFTSVSVMFSSPNISNLIFTSHKFYFEMVTFVFIYVNQFNFYRKMLKFCVIRNSVFFTSCELNTAEAEMKLGVWEECHVEVK